MGEDKRRSKPHNPEEEKMKSEMARSAEEGRKMSCKYAVPMLSEKLTTWVMVDFSSPIPGPTLTGTGAGGAGPG